MKRERVAQHLPPGHDRLRLVSAREAARFLGLSLSQLYRLRERGDGPPGYRIGRHIRFRWADLSAWQQRDADTR